MQDPTTAALPEVTARPGGGVRIELHESDARLLIQVLNQAIQPGIAVVGRHRADASPAPIFATERLRHLRRELFKEQQLAAAATDTVLVPLVGRAR